jgi:hypothetical protein
MNTTILTLDLFALGITCLNFVLPAKEINEKLFPVTKVLI